MARKLRGFERVLDAPALFAVAYGEIASSLYVALGIVAASALGVTPLVLLATGALFLVVSLSYAEGTAAIPEAGGSASFDVSAFLRAPLPRGGNLGGCAPPLSLGRDHRLRRDRGGGGHPPRPPHTPPHGRARDRAARPPRAGHPRRAR